MRGSAAAGLAEAAYAGRDWGLLPVLADALEEAGTDPHWALDLMRHAPHLFGRGCWALDVLTGRRA